MPPEHLFGDYMTRDEFLFLIQTEKPYEFTFGGVKYNITYDKDSSGKTVVSPSLQSRIVSSV